MRCLLISLFNWLKFYFLISTNVYDLVRNLNFQESDLIFESFFHVFGS
ncbi:hypothetical protein LEP1GSC096_2838 [Leptospira interrogans serovar Hebdomadis str. R499]|nr:hypothetical protein LEP1GSC045_1834 [Leptospira interrogans serovar Pomona str. Kennewicki LC82-25]EKN98386.1 hypothetical protein LEP1GSC014_1965 [Leptospira interrogans serovar Pomona str. Pomona]EKR34109.1 hypothetical protein LEP1GSC096_2838 [Leptospira interrogans serovar Hebdomadis str. R499]EMF32477.1 hypothetical protein LEP1GSC201_1348 [Leptospira interrogans serovar Pomona str. Fox 32256]EMI63413.1 hypothetical protein LEP1GSC200_1336 [Leptospira interrogans serovar Pomona str. CS